MDKLVILLSFNVNLVNYLFVFCGNFFTIYIPASSNCTLFTYFCIRKNECYLTTLVSMITCLSFPRKPDIKKNLNVPKGLPEALFSTIA